jgi:hypothetical protein
MSRLHTDDSEISLGGHHVPRMLSAQGFRPFSSAAVTLTCTYVQYLLAWACSVRSHT